MRIEDLETPVPVIDLDRVEHNLAKMQAYCDSHSLRLRPHIKTHKIPGFAHRQVELGAHGITCQKLGEAEVMVDAGLDDIFISYPLVGPAKALRLAELSRRAKLSVGIDNHARAGNDCRGGARLQQCHRRAGGVRQRQQAHGRHLRGARRWNWRAASRKCRACASTG